MTDKDLTSRARAVVREVLAIVGSFATIVFVLAVFLYSWRVKGFGRLPGGVLVRPERQVLRQHPALDVPGDLSRAPGSN